MLLLHPALTCTDAGPDLCTLHPDLYGGGLSPSAVAQILHLRTWWFYPMQLALVVFFLPPTGADTVLVLRQLALVVFFLPPTGADTVLALGNLHCVVVVFWWWW